MVSSINSGLPNPAASGTIDNSSFLQLCRPSKGDSTPTGHLEGLLTELLTLSSIHRERKPTQIIIQHGDHGKVGVPHEVFNRYSKYVRFSDRNFKWV